MNLSAFLAENALAVENVKFAASKRFMGDDGKPMLWEIKTITGTEDEALRKSCAKRVPTPARRISIRRKLIMICTLGSWLWPVRCSPI